MLINGWEENEISIRGKAHGGTELTCFTLQDRLPKELLEDFQIIPSRVRKLYQDKIRVLHVHNLPEDPELSHLKQSSSFNRFHGIVFLSNWHIQNFVSVLNIPQDERSIVIESPIDPIPLIKKPTDKINLIYFSTPHRGLEILVPVFEELAKKYDNIHLNVHSTFKLYGWPQMDNQFEPLYQRIREHPQMTYDDEISYPKIIQSLQNSHILSYPCIWKETLCRVLIESMSAGLVCVHPNLAALAETSGSLTHMYQYYDDRQKHTQSFYHHLENAILNIKSSQTQNKLKLAKKYADFRYSYDNMLPVWVEYLSDLKRRFPSIESRKYQEETQMFKYKF